MKLLYFILTASIVSWFTFLGVFGPLVHAEIFGDYLGWKACAECHEEKALGWEKTPHAKAFDHLKQGGKEGATGCIKCHVVHFDEDGGFIDMDLTPELAGVQCESCHGPGKRHVENQEERGHILARPDKACCRQCHTPGQDTHFDYDEKVQRVHGS